MKMGKNSKQVEGKNENSNKTLDNTADEGSAERPPYSELARRISVIAKPLASKKLTKKVFKTIKKGQ